MSKRIKLMILSIVIIVGMIVVYFALTYQSPEEWLKDYLYEVYGGEQWVKVGEDGKYYVIKVNTHPMNMTYEDGVIKADRTFEYCLQPERNYYEGDDIFITADKAVYNYEEDKINFTIRNNSGLKIGTGLQHNAIDLEGRDAYDLDVYVDGQWYAVFLGIYSDRFKSSYQVIESDKIYGLTIPTDVYGFPKYSIKESGKIYSEENYFKLRPGLYRISKIIRYPIDKNRPWVKELTYITCTFEIK